MRTASSSGESDRDKAGHPKINAPGKVREPPQATAQCNACRKRRPAAPRRLSRAGRAWHRAQQIANRRADRKNSGILAGKADDLQAERQPLGRQYRQRQGGNAEHRGGHVEDRIAGRAEPDRSSARCGEGDRRVVARREPRVDLAVALPARDCAALIGQGHRLGDRQAIERRLAELAAITLAIGVE
jgi:hypothetical protein